LQKEIKLVAAPNARIIAVGNLVSQYLERRRFRPFTPVIHYSGLAGPARIAGIKGREDDFQAFMGSVCHEDLLATAEDVLRAARVPAEIHDDTLSRLKKFHLTTSRQQLIFNYKAAFEAMRS
jgi:hypothetical protein